MEKDENEYLLYAVTDRTWLGGESLDERVEKAIQGGVTMVQLREKDMGFDDFLRTAKSLKKVTDRYGVKLIINDRIDVAMEADAAGVHLGQGDMEARHARGLMGEGKIVGVSARTVEQAMSAEKSGADYIGTGAVFSTSTKGDARPVSLRTVSDICSAVSIPVVGIGGITRDNISSLKDCGLDGVAVVSAIFARQDTRSAAEELVSLWRKEALE